MVHRNGRTRERERRRGRLHEPSGHEPRNGNARCDLDESLREPGASSPSENGELGGEHVAATAGRAETCDLRLAAARRSRAGAVVHERVASSGMASGSASVSPPRETEQTRRGRRGRP